MEWTKFNTHGESSNHAFEVMCNILFEGWCKREYKDNLKYFSFVNGSGGDGGVEAYATLDSGEVIGVQSKWFPDKMETLQFNQIEKSFNTAIKVRPEMIRYIVCIPRDFTSKKMAKNGKIAKNTEENNWRTLLEKLKNVNSSVSVELWDATTIQAKLMTPEAMGCYKYWFDNTEVFDTEIVKVFEKAINSWAKTKYIHDLYSTGYIHDKLEIFTGNYGIVEKRYDGVQKVLSVLERLKKEYGDILKLKFPEKEQSVVENIKLDIDTINEWISRFVRIEKLVIDGAEVKEDFLDERIGLKCISSELKDSSLYFHHYSHFTPVIEILENIVDEVCECCQLLNSDFDNRIIFLGNQGTGKTAGIVAEANALLQEKSHLPILVRAKEFSTGDNWLSILTRTLELPNKWSDRELLRALENAALLRNKLHKTSERVNIQPKCLICVDGIEESLSWSFWEERIEEAKAYEKDFAGIKFVFLARPYVFNEYYKLDYRDCFCRMPTHGDVSVAELFDNYIAYYNIELDGNNWIKGMLRTPMALKLFCDIYKNSKVGTLSKNSVVITKLFEEKIKSIENVYRKSGKETDNQSMVMEALVMVATMLVDKSDLSYDEIYSVCKEPLKSHLEDVLRFIEVEGFIYSRLIQKDAFSIPETKYSLGMQPAFDYLMARKIYEAFKENKTIETEYSQGVYQLLSLIVIEEDRKLLFEYSNIELSNESKFDLVCYALANTSVEIASKYGEYIKILMNYSADEFREIFERIILPVSSVPNHPLGSVLLDDFLRNFDEPAQRDIWWSIPTYLRDNFDAEWRSYTEIDTTSIILSNEENYLGLPLILVWRLSSVDNDVRRECRFKLTEWGINNQEQFFHLFSYCADINDEQIIEDIFSIAYGIALGKDAQDEYLINLSDWIMENVFSDEGLIKYGNVVVRFYCTGIVKMAIFKEVYDKEVENKLIPPYAYQAKIMPAYEDAFDAKRMSGYGPIDYDLARYVLCDHFDCFFRTDYTTNKYSDETENLFEEYKREYNIDSLEMDGLIISVAYQYLLDQGWKKKTFWEYKDKKNIGVDISIRRTFYPATHGTQSRVMTIAEKYVWCAKHRIEAMLANRVKCSGYGRDDKFINDYSDLEKFINTYQDYINSKNKAHKDLWLHTDQMVCSQDDEYSIKSIEAWMTDGKIPEFSAWLKDNQGDEILYAYTSITNELAGIEETIWISSGAVKCDEFDDFIKRLNVYWEARFDLLNVSDFHALQDCQCYCTPQEACTIQSHKEVENTISVEIDNITVRINKLVTECTTAYAEDMESSFDLPSKLVRDLIEIKYGDGYKYLNNDGELIGKYISVGENWKNQQKCLLVDRKALKEAFDKEQYKMFWLFRVYRSPSHKAYEAFGRDIMHDTDRSFVVWHDEDEYKYVELQNIEPPRTEMKEYESIIKFYYSDIEE